MALIKEPYGLVYNTDGSLCTTYRDDDVPFQGVRSFAVEEATENLITDLDPRNWNNDNTIVELTDDKYMGMPVYKVTMPETTNPRIFVNIPYTDGMTLTGSVYIKGIQYSSVSRPFLIFRETGFGSAYKTQLFPTNIGQWQRISVTHTFAGDGSVMFLLYTPINTNDIPNIFYMAMPQVEEKSFATSFVDGSRPRGVVKWVDDAFDKHNLVIVQWIKHIGYSESLHSITRLATTKEDFSAYFGIMPKDNTINLRNDTITTKKTINIEDVQNKWVFEVFILDGLTAKYKIIGENIVEELTAIAVTDEPWNKIFGYMNTVKGENLGLVANLYTGKYRRPDGTVIWTDDYIREVYEAKIPFPVSNKLSIY